MSVWKRANPIMLQVSFIIVRAKGDFLLFDGLELIFKWLFSLQSMHKFSFFKEIIYLVLMANVFFDYFLLDSLCLLNFFFFYFQLIHFGPQTDKLLRKFSVQFTLFFTNYSFVFIIIEWAFFRSQKNWINAYQHRHFHAHYPLEFDTWDNLFW